MKKFVFPAFTLIISAFLFVSNVSAQTYSYTIPTDLTRLSSSDFDTIRSLISSQNISNYIVTYSIDTNPHYKVFKLNTNSLTSSIKNSSYTIFQMTNPCNRYAISNDLSSITFKTNSCSSEFISLFPPYYTSPDYIVLSNMNLIFTSYIDNVSYTYIDKVYTMPSSSDMRLYTIYDMYTDYNTDPYPLLSDFFTITIDKLKALCSFFTSSYIYLSVFVILMLYFTILLIRRLA